MSPLVMDRKYCAFAQEVGDEIIDGIEFKGEFELEMVLFCADDTHRVLGEIADWEIALAVTQSQAGGSGALWPVA